MATIKKLRTIIRYSSVQDEPILVKPGPTTKSIPRTQINTIGHPVQLKMAPQTVAAVLGLRSLLNAFKGSIDYAKGLVNSKYLTYPSVKGSVIREFSIKRDEYTIIEGIKYKNECDSSMDAEWIFQEIPDIEDLNALRKKRVVLFIHGGAYVIGTIKLYRSITSRIAQYADASVLAINYRLSPAHVYPIPLIDAITAYKYLLDSGYEPNNISIVGDSAGAGIATALMLYCRDSSNVPMPACVACMSPYYDLTHALPSWRLNEVSCYLPEGILDLKYISETRSNLAVGHDGG